MTRFFTGRVFTVSLPICRTALVSIFFLGQLKRADKGLEVSANNRAGCQAAHCKAEGTKIKKGELRQGVMVTIKEHQSMKWRHWYEYRCHSLTMTDVCQGLLHSDHHSQLGGGLRDGHGHGGRVRRVARGVAGES